MTVEFIKETFIKHKLHSSRTKNVLTLTQRALL